LINSRNALNLFSQVAIGFEIFCGRLNGYMSAMQRWDGSEVTASGSERLAQHVTTDEDVPHRILLE
jgi:hypothetical protein